MVFFWGCPTQLAFAGEHPMKSSTGNIPASNIDVGGVPDTARNVAAGPVSAGSCQSAEGVAAAPAVADRWSHGLQWPSVLWIILLHVGAVGCAIRIHLEGAVAVPCSVVADRRVGRVPGIPPANGPPKFPDVSDRTARYSRCWAPWAAKVRRLPGLACIANIISTPTSLATRIRRAKAPGGAMCSGSFLNRVSPNGPR